MRSFDEWFDENCDGSDLAKDACRKLWDEFSDQINIICRKSYEKQQSKVDELQKQRDSFIKAYEIEIDKSDELQKRLDAAIYLLPSIKAENDLWGCDQVERQIELIEQTLKGGGE